MSMSMGENVDSYFILKWSICATGTCKTFEKIVVRLSVRAPEIPTLASMFMHLRRNACFFF